MASSTSQAGSYVALEMTERKRGSSAGSVKRIEDSDVPGCDLDEVFWMKVRNKYNESEISWNRAMDEVRAEQLIENYENSGGKLSEAPLLVMLKKWPTSKKYHDNLCLKAALEHLINRLTEIILEKETGVDYKYFRDREDPQNKTLVHLAAELNYVSICRTLLEHFPGQLYITSKAHSVHRRYLPVELALINCNDAVAAFLISRMKHERVQQLFLCEDQEHPGNFSFKRLIESPDMKKTVVAVLNCMVTPHWPYLPERKNNYESREEEENIEHAWNSAPEEPMSYQFYYQILDGDEWGRLPKVPDPDDENKMIYNKHFNWKSKSCLYSIAFSDNKEAVQHPVVRLLVKKKWKEYALTWFCATGGFYLTFLLLLSYALIRASTRDDPTQYNSGADWLRQACEICVIVMVIVYIAEEINQLEKERLRYFQNVFNWFDWFGLFSILLILPLRYAKRDEQWVFATTGYFFNFLRLFKYSCVSRFTGLYTKTLAKIIRRDITRFAVVFLVVFLTFCGCFVMAIRATGTSNLYGGGYRLVMLAGVRALVEQQAVADDYEKFKWLPVIVVVCYMATVVVIMLNVLIAQLSSTFSETKKMARLQYDKERMLIITRLEHSRLHQLNLRVMYFKEVEWIDELRLANELLEYSEDRHPLENIEERLDAIRAMMKKIIKKIPLTITKTA